MREIFSESITFVRRHIYNDNDQSDANNDEDDRTKSDQVKQASGRRLITIWPRPFGLLQLVPLTCFLHIESKLNC